MVRHGIVAGLSVTERSNTPAAAERLGQELRRDRRRMLGGGDAAKQQVPRVGRANATRGAAPIKRDGVKIHFRQPEMKLDRGPKALGARAPLGRVFLITARGRQFANRFQCRAGIALYFNDRNGPLRQPSVGMEDRVLAVLPPLVGQPRLLPARIVQKAGGAAIQTALDPADRGA